MMPTIHLKDRIAQPYYSISDAYQKRFQQKVYKIPVGMQATCPNRKRGEEHICIFCDEWGSAAASVDINLPIVQQLAKNKKSLQTRFKAKQFLAYFQPYTTGFGEFSILQEKIKEAIQDEDVCGVVIGTRPDCLPKKLRLFLHELTQQGLYVSIEIGVQSFKNERLLFLRREHTIENVYKSVDKIKQDAPLIDIGIHLIFGLPNETEEEIFFTANKVNELAIHNVKLHNLHVLRNTPLEELYNQGEFIPIELDAYAETVRIFLEKLSPSVAVQRLAALSDRWEQLVSPMWIKKKLQTIQYIIKRMNEANSFQGKFYR